MKTFVKLIVHVAVKVPVRRLPDWNVLFLSWLPKMTTLQLFVIEMMFFVGATMLLSLTVKLVSERSESVKLNRDVAFIVELEIWKLLIAIVECPVAEAKTCGKLVWLRLKDLMFTVELSALISENCIRGDLIKRASKVDDEPFVWTKTEPGFVMAAEKVTETFGKNTLD